MRTVMRAAMAGVAVAVLGAPGPAKAAALWPTGPSTVRSVGTNACLTAVSEAAVTVEPCDRTARQVFMIQPAGNDAVMLRHNGWCVRVAPGSPPVNPVRLGHCTGAPEERFRPTSLWRDSTFVLYLTNYSLRATRVGDSPFITWNQPDPGAFQEWQLLPPA